MQETLLRAWQHPEVTEDAERSARAWLFTVARNMIIDERRSPQVPQGERLARNREGPESAGPDEVDPRWTDCCSATRWHSCRPNTAR